MGLFSSAKALSANRDRDLNYECIQGISKVQVSTFCAFTLKVGFNFPLHGVFGFVVEISELFLWGAPDEVL